jgi:CspA family cold shock protein
MSIGTVKWFNATKGYGFIQPDDGSKDVFLHISDVERAGIGTPQEGQKLEYEVQRGQQGSRTNLVVVTSRQTLTTTCFVLSRSTPALRLYAI